MKKAMARAKVIKELKAAFLGIDGIMAADDWGAKGAIHLGNCAEGGEIDYLPACDYYAEDYMETTYEMGVHKKLVWFLRERGWFVECHDAGTYLAYKI